MKRKALVIGATGLVGSNLIKELSHSSNYEEITVLNRRKIDYSSSKISELVIDFDRLDEALAATSVDDIFCCLGTTIRKAGSKKEFVKVDLELPLITAQILFENKAQRFFLISSIGANIDSKSFYLRTKGLLEKELQILGFNKLYIFRPSVLDGHREESRPLESLGIRIGNLFSGIPILNKYSPTKVSELVNTIMHFVIKDSEANLDIIEAIDIKRINREN